jgi:DNA replication and repair protein RecF
LLDEVAAHLDKDRRRHLFERVLASGAQAWLTGTDVSVFTDLGQSAQLFSVSDGAVKPVSSATIVSHPSSLSLPPTQRV